MSKGLEALKEIKKDTPFSQAFNPKFKERIVIIENELNILKELASHITDFYKKREIDYYADSEAFYYDYYIVFDKTALKVNEHLYYSIKEYVGKKDELDKCIEY